MFICIDKSGACQASTVVRIVFALQTLSQSKDGDGETYLAEPLLAVLLYVWSCRLHAPVASKQMSIFLKWAYLFEKPPSLVVWLSLLASRSFCTNVYILQGKLLSAH